MRTVHLLDTNNTLRAQPMRIVSIIFTGVVLLAGCLPTPPTPVEPATRFTCMSVPSSVYKPGTILRTMRESAGDEEVEALTYAYAPIVEPQLENNFFGDYSSTLKRGASVQAVADTLKRFGFEGTLDANARYDLAISVTDNLHYVSSDNVLSDTIDVLNQDDTFIISGARYYFVKEALASNRVAYVAQPEFGATASIEILAKQVDLDITADFYEGVATVGGADKRLVACVVLERIPVNLGLVGDPTFSKDTLRTTTEEYELIDGQFADFAPD